MELLSDELIILVWLLKTSVLEAVDEMADEPDDSENLMEPELVKDLVEDNSVSWCLELIVEELLAFGMFNDPELLLMVK